MNDHYEYIDRALELAAEAAGSTFPNPLVGAVIVKDGNVVGEGRHGRAGGPHAEIEALTKAGGSAEGATLYLNLEPCCHRGRTGPCTDAIMKAGISKVVFSIYDPDPRVKGRGGAILRENGVEVVTGIRAEEAVVLNLPFIHHAITGRPMVVLKLALTLDGKLTAPGRDWLTGEDSGKRVHLLRTSLEAIAVGAGTLKEDAPLLDRRLAGRKIPPPVRMVFDTKLEVSPPSSWDTVADRVIYFCTGEASPGRKASFEALGVEVVVLPGSEEGLDLGEWSRSVEGLGISSVLVEGGGRVATSIVEEGLADRIVLLHAPLLGGTGGVDWYGSGTRPGWMEKDGLVLTSVERIGNDVMTVYDRQDIGDYTRILSSDEEVGGR